MAPDVVERLEAVEVEVHERYRTTFLLAAEGESEPFVDDPAVPEAGDRVLARLLVEFVDRFVVCHFDTAAMADLAPSHGDEHEGERHGDAAPGDDTPTLSVAAADATSVSIPGSAVLEPATTGLELPDGTQITVGPDGSATIGGIVLEPGTIAVVVNGVVEVVELPSRDVASPPLETSTTTTTSSLVEQDATSTSTTTTTTTTAAPETTTTAAPSTTEAPRPTTADAPPAPVVPSIVLTITPTGNGEAVLEWTVDPDDARVSTWVVRRGRGTNSEVVTVIRQGDARRQVVALPDRNVAWQVTARDGRGRVIARSEFVRP